MKLDNLKSIDKLTKKNVRALAKKARKFAWHDFEFEGRKYRLMHDSRNGYTLKQSYQGLHTEQSQMLFTGVSNIDRLHYKMTKGADSEDGLGFEPVAEEIDIETEPLGDQQLEGRKAILSRAYYDAPVEERVCECTGGFGCDATALGSAVFVKLSNGESQRFERYMFEAVVAE